MKRKIIVSKRRKSGVEPEGGEDQAGKWWLLKF